MCANFSTSQPYKDAGTFKKIQREVGENDEHEKAEVIGCC